jgi:hypothetical protein
MSSREQVKDLTEVSGGRIEDLEAKIFLVEFLKMIPHRRCAGWPWHGGLASRGWWYGK